MSKPAPIERSVVLRIASSTGVISLATAVSRILGFVRDLLIARFFGTLEQAQAFVVAFRLPNLLRDMVAEGAVSSAFVPILSSYRAKKDRDQFWKVCSSLLSRMLVILFAIGLLGSFGAPFIVRLIAPGFVSDPEKFDLTVRLTRILFPFITLVGIWAYFMGLLNSMRHFLMPSFGPALLNLAMIIACIWFVPRTHPGVTALAFGVLIGGLLQIAIQIPVAMKMGFRFRFSWRSESSQKIMKLLGPRMVGSSVYQLNVFIDTILASLSHVVGEGAVAALYFANRLVQLPLAMFGTASAQASLPALSEHASAGDIKSFHSILLSVLRMVAFVVLPSAFGLVALSYPIVKTLFERGAFDQNATLMTSQALVFYAAGLLGFSFNKVLTGAFYALHDTWTPVKLTMRAVAISLVLSVLLMFPMRLSGIALAASIANTLNAYHLLRHIQIKLGRHMIKHLVFPIFKMMCASAIMALSCFGGWILIGPALGQLVALPVLIISGLFCYAACCLFFKVSELSSALRWIKSACKSPAPCVSD